MRVYAVDDRLMPRLGSPGRYVARDANKAALPDGEDVPEIDLYVRAVRDGDLSLTAPAPAPKPSKPDKELV